MALFAQVVDCGSFRGAAESLALSPSVISHHIRQLEENTGKQLIYRNTRNLSLTADGRIFLDSARQMIAAAASGFDRLASGKEITGELRVALPTALSRARYFAAIADFETAHPRITLSLSFGDRPTSHFEEGFDVALAFEQPNDRNLTSRKIADVERYIVGSEQYFERAGIPQSPAALAAHEWIWLNSYGTRLDLQRSGQGRETIAIKPRVRVDNAMGCLRLALEGLGLAVVPDFVVKEEVGAGRLRRIMTDWSLDPMALYATWPKTKINMALTQLFVDAFSASIAQPDPD